MPRTDSRGGPDTRRRIAGIASRLFLERGFDAVTVAEVAREAGVSSVTVFKHFPRKEDLFLDRTADAFEVLRSAVRGRGSAAEALESLRGETLHLVDERHALAGVDPRSATFFRTVANSPALIARSRELLAELRDALARELAATEAVGDDEADLFAALFFAGYASVFVRGARAVLAAEASGASADDLPASQRRAFERMFAVLRDGLTSVPPVS